MRLYLKRIWEETNGQDTVEYTLALGVVAVAIVAASPQVGNTLNNAFSRIVSVVTSAVS